MLCTVYGAVDDREAHSNILIQFLNKYYEKNVIKIAYIVRGLCGDFAMMEGKWWCVRHLALISLSTVAVVAQRSCPAGEKTLTIRMTAAGTTADGSEFFILSIVKVQAQLLAFGTRACSPTLPTPSRPPRRERSPIAQMGKIDNSDKRTLTVMEP